jgi:putative flippase GtrA
VPELVRTSLQLLRYGVAGVANTLVGLAVISALDIGCRVEPHLANAAGYGAGLVVGFWLNKVFVFRVRERAGSMTGKYVLAAISCFLLNQLILTAAQAAIGQAGASRLLAQTLAVAGYSVAMFLLCRTWVFAGPKHASAFAGRSSAAVYSRRV